MLTSAELTGMRDAVEASLPGTAIIQTRVFHSDGGGGGTTTWTAVGTVSCRLSPMSGMTSFDSEGMTAGRITQQAKWLLTLPQSSTVTTDSRVKINAGTYEVLALHEPRSWDLCRRAELSEMT